MSVRLISYSGYCGIFLVIDYFFKLWRFYPFSFNTIWSIKSSPVVSVLCYSSYSFCLFAVSFNVDETVKFLNYIHLKLLDIEVRSNLDA